MSGFLTIGHRGARGFEPENTLRSIRRAFELGADGVEIDVWRVENELIVIHDSTLERTTNGSGSILKKTLAELRALDAGHGEQIPTLREVFETVAGCGLINIELKGTGTAELVRSLIEEFVQKGSDFRDFLVSSFHRRELATLRESTIRIGVLCVRPTPLYHVYARKLRATSIHPAARHTTRRFVEGAHRRGFQVFPYTVNTPAEIARMRQLAVDGVFTDYPDRVICGSDAGDA